MSAELAVARALYAQEVKRHLLALREALVRHDENLAAHALMTEAVPYFLRDDPEVKQARADQEAMVRHITEPATYSDYYANNAHERPFEDQYGIAPEEAHKHIYRVEFLRERLKALCEERGCMPADLRIIDVSANDGWMAVNLGQFGYTLDCVDLNPSNCDLARERKREGQPGIGQVKCKDLHDLRTSRPYDVAVCFETLEHVGDPSATLAVLRRLVADDGRVVVSTPHEAIEQGNVPNWAHVEPKGHVRAITVAELGTWLLEIGDIEEFRVGPDRVIVAEVKPTSG